MNGDEILDVVNFKCDQILIDSLTTEPKFFPAYHINKENWITVALDGCVSDEKIIMLLDISFELTTSNKKKD